MAHMLGLRAAHLKILAFLDVVSHCVPSLCFTIVRHHRYVCQHRVSTHGQHRVPASCVSMLHRVSTSCVMHTLCVSLCANNVCQHRVSTSWANIVCQHRGPTSCVTIVRHHRVVHKQTAKHVCQHAYLVVELVRAGGPAPRNSRARLKPRPPTVAGGRAAACWKHSRIAMPGQGLRKASNRQQTLM